MVEFLSSLFEGARARRAVALELLRLGLKVDGRGRVYVGAIEVQPAKIARALGVDRRVVIETAKAIAGDDKLLPIFYRLEPRAFIGNVAGQLGLDAIEIRADPNKPGIVAAVTAVLAKERISIRQIISDDPDLFPDPVLTIIIDGRISAGAIRKLKSLKFATAISIK